MAVETTERMAEMAAYGLRFMRAPARTREIRRKHLADPDMMVDAYREGWESQLNAEGGPWGWNVVGRTINWKHYRSMHRVYVMLGEADRLHHVGHRQAHMQTVQAMKSVSTSSASMGTGGRPGGSSA